MAHKPITAKIFQAQLRAVAKEMFAETVAEANAKKKARFALRADEESVLAISARRQNPTLTMMLHSLSEFRLGRTWELTLHRSALEAGQPSVDHGCRCCDQLLHRSHIEAKARRLSIDPLTRTFENLNICGLPAGKPQMLIPTLLIRPDRALPEVLWLDGRWVTKNGGQHRDGKLQVNITPSGLDRLREEGRIVSFAQLAANLNKTCSC